MRTRLAWITGIALVLLAAIAVVGAVGALIPGVLPELAARIAFGVVAVVGLAGFAAVLVEMIAARRAD